MFLSVTELTQRNVALHKAAEKAIDAADAIRKEAEQQREAIRNKYSGPEWSELGNAARQHAIQIETERAMKPLRAKLAATRELLQNVSKHAGEISANEPFYQPIKRLSWTTMLDENLASRRSTYTKNLEGVGVAELETMLDVFKATSDLAGLAALSAEINARDDAVLRKRIPNARIVEGLKFNDEDQMAAIFHAGKHMVDVVIRNEREVKALLNGRRANPIDRVRAGLEAKEAGAEGVNGNA